MRESSSDGRGVRRDRAARKEGAGGSKRRGGERRNDQDSFDEEKSADGLRKEVSEELKSSNGVAAAAVSIVLPISRSSSERRKEAMKEKHRTIERSGKREAAEERASGEGVKKK